MSRENFRQTLVYPLINYREEFIQKALWDAYLKLEERQRSAFWNLVASFGIASVLISLKPDQTVPFVGLPLSRELVFGSATCFVFVMAGRFYFLSVYRFEKYARRLKTFSKPPQVARSVHRVGKYTPASRR